MEAPQEKTHTCGTVCLKYVLLLFNILLWLSGSMMLAVGVWTLLQQSVYLHLLSVSESWSWSWVSAVVPAACGGVVLLSSLLGCCATLKEKRTLLVLYLSLLLCLFLLELLAAVLAFITYQECFPLCYQLEDNQRFNIKLNMQQKYQQPGEEVVTQALDRLQQEFQCCGSFNSSDWAENIWIQSSERLVPDSCCKTPMILCGRRDHPSNIYRVEGGCISKLEQFLLQQLHLLTLTALGVSVLQLLGMMFTCCLYQHLKEDLY